VKNGAVSVAFGKKLVIKMMMMMVEEKEKINIVWCIVYTILFLLLKIKVEIRTKKSLREREVQRKEYLLKQDT
jgi:hypothetical protein